MKVLSYSKKYFIPAQINYPYNFSTCLYTFDPEFRSRQRIYIPFGNACTETVTWVLFLISTLSTCCCPSRLLISSFSQLSLSLRLSTVSVVDMGFGYALPPDEESVPGEEGVLVGALTEKIRVSLTTVRTVAHMALLVKKHRTPLPGAGV